MQGSHSDLTVERIREQVSTVTWQYHQTMQRIAWLAHARLDREEQIHQLLDLRRCARKDWAWTQQVQMNLKAWRQAHRAEARALRGYQEFLLVMASTFDQVARTQELDSLAALERVPEEILAKMSLYPLS